MHAVLWTVKSNVTVTTTRYVHLSNQNAANLQIQQYKYLRKCTVFSANSRRFDFVEIAKISMCLQRHSMSIADAKEIRQKVQYVNE